MENRWTVLKVVALVLVAVVVSCVSFNAHAQYVDLKGGTEKSPWMPCSENSNPKVRLVCVIVEKEGKTYIVLHDDKGELKIFLIEGEKASLIWARNSV